MGTQSVQTDTVSSSEKGETQEQAIERMINLLESVGIEHLQGSIAEENTEIQNAYE